MSKQEAVRRSGEDWISFLPDPLLCQILSDLPTKATVTTSVLSKRWRHLWLSTPILDLNIDDFPDYTTFTSFVSRFLDFSKESCLHKLKLVFKRQYDDDSSLLTSLIETAVLRKIQHLEVDCTMSFMFEMMPPSLYLCETLVSLRLRFVALRGFHSLSLPNLKIICQYMNFEPVPSFPNMIRLQTKLYITDMELSLLKFLESFPNLQTLILKLKGVTYTDNMRFSLVPKCLQTSLECIELTRPNCGAGIEMVMKLVKYLLEKSVVLKKFTLRLECDGKEQESIIVTEFMSFRRCSSACVVNVVRLEDDACIFQHP